MTDGDGFSRVGRGWRGASAFLAGAVFAAALLPGSGLSAPATPVSGEKKEKSSEIVVGVILELSGRHALFGREASDAILLERVRVNEEGGVGGRRIRVVKIDLADKPQRAARAVVRLVRQEGALAIIGPVGFRTAKAASASAESEEIPLLTLSASEEVVEPVRPWTFSVAQTNALAARRILLHMRFRNIRRGALLTSAGPYGSGGRESFRAWAPAVGLSFLLDERYPPGTHNFLPYLQRASRRGAEAIVHWALGSSQVALLRQKMALDLRLPFYMASAVSRKFTLKGGGKAVEGALFPASRVLAYDLLPKNDLGRASIGAFRLRFQARFGRQPDGYAGYGADAFRLLVAALRTGGPNRKKVREKLEKRSVYNGLTGRYRFSERDHNGLNPGSFIMVRVRKQKWTRDKSVSGGTGRGALK